MVIIKGVKLFQTNGWKEYSDLDIMQMMGRAVRTYIPGDINDSPMLTEPGTTPIWQASYMRH